MIYFKCKTYDVEQSQNVVYYTLFDFHLICGILCMQGNLPLCVFRYR